MQMVARTTFGRTRTILQDALDNKLFTGAAACVSHGGQIVFTELFGKEGDAGTPQVTNRTLFDLASLTKIVGTTLAWVDLAAQEKGILDTCLGRWFDSVPSDKVLITPRHLLAHTSGLPHWRPYYLMIRTDGAPDTIISWILAEPLCSSVGSRCVYSDLGFILLGRMLELYWGRSLDELLRERIYGPLELQEDIVFRPDPNRHSVAWTRSSEPPGLVNDLNARAMGGVAGHAGLFGTALGITEIADQLLASLTSSTGFFPSQTARLFCKRLDAPEGMTRTLGFDSPSPEGSSSGSRFSQTSIGHTGFTGTSIWIDPARKVVVTLLTNRVFMGESDQRIKALRPMFHDAVMGEILKDESPLI